MPAPSVATLILNRNLPAVTDKLVDHLRQRNGDLTEIYVIESGSDKDKLSKHCSFWANWPEALEKGLRWARGFNYGLMELAKTGKQYDFYFLVMGDSVFDDQPTIAPLVEVMNQYPRLGILSPLSGRWSEAQFLSPAQPTKCFWLFPHVSWLFRRELLDTLIAKDNPSITNYLYDGTNFRGYYDDIEVIVRAYQNDFAAAITSRATFVEEEEITLKNAAIMKTDTQAVHRTLMVDEGLVWMKQKYGFADKGAFKEWAFREYTAFMNRHPEYQPLSIGLGKK